MVNYVEEIFSRQQLAERALTKSQAQWTLCLYPPDLTLLDALVRGLPPIMEKSRSRSAGLQQ